MKTAVITGAAQGIGKQTATLLNELGWALALIDLQPVDTQHYKNVIALTGDITDEKFVIAAAAETMNKFNRVDALVNKDRKSTRLNSSHGYQSRMPSSA